MRSRKDQFEIRIRELEEAIDRLRQRRTAGWRYSKTWVRGSTVKEHKRHGHWAMLPVKNK